MFKLKFVIPMVMMAVFLAIPVIAGVETQPAVPKQVTSIPYIWEIIGTKMEGPDVAVYFANKCKCSRYSSEPVSKGDGTLTWFGERNDGIAFLIVTRESDSVVIMTAFGFSDSMVLMAYHEWLMMNDFLISEAEHSGAGNEFIYMMKKNIGVLVSYPMSMVIFLDLTAHIQ